MNEATAAPDAGPARADDALMLRIAERDAVAFGRVVDAHVERLHRIAWRMIGDAAEAEDVAQESLLRLWSGAESWRTGQAGIGPWLNRVTVNQCLDRLRRRRFGSDAEVPERADEAPLADEAMDADRLRGLTLAAIGALTERHRAAIVLTYYEELPNAAAAEALEMNLKAFESLLLRARKALREELAAHGLVSLNGEGT